jgi:hypothetical protein
MVVLGGPDGLSVARPFDAARRHVHLPIEGPVLRLAPNGSGGVFALVEPIAAAPYLVSVSVDSNAHPIAIGSGVPIAIVAANDGTSDIWAVEAAGERQTLTEFDAQGRIMSGPFPWRSDLTLQASTRSGIVATSAVTRGREDLVLVDASSGANLWDLGINRVALGAGTDAILTGAGGCGECPALVVADPAKRSERSVVLPIGVVPVGPGVVSTDSRQGALLVPPQPGPTSEFDLGIVDLTKATISVPKTSVMPTLPLAWTKDGAAVLFRSASTQHLAALFTKDGQSIEMPLDVAHSSSLVIL